MSDKARRSLYAFFIILCLGVILGGVYLLVSNTKLAPDEKKETVTESASQKEDIVVGYSKEDDFELRLSEGKLSMYHKGLGKELDWTGEFSPENIQFGTGDFDGDTLKEAVVIFPTGKNLTELHIVKPRINGVQLDFNDSKFTVDSINLNSYAENGFNAVQTDNQKRVKFTFNKQDFYFRALANDNGTYKKFVSLGLTGCSYKLTDGKITVEASLGAMFENEKEAMNVGSITSELAYDKTQYVFKNAAFKADPAASISPPATNVKPFEVTFRNNDPKTNTGLVLSDIEFTLDMAASQRSFDTGVSEEKYLSYITVTNKYIKLAVNDSMSFDRLATEASLMTIWVGGENGFYVQGKTQIVDGGDYYYLVTYFDEPVSKEQMTSLTYKLKV